MEESEDHSTPFKGKPSSFFVMNWNDAPFIDPTNPYNYYLNNEQWAFIFLHYSEYAASPYEMMSWLFI